MQVALGAHAEGKEGGLGTIERFIFHLQSQQVSDMVIRHGLIAQEHVVPLDCLTRADGDRVYIDLTNADLDESRTFTQAGYRAPETDFAAPPSVGNSDIHGIEYQLDEAQAHGAVRGVAGKAMGYPGGEVIVPDDAQILVLSKGTQVFDVDGEVIGTIDGATVDSATGELLTVSLSGGMLRSSDSLPVEWVDKVAPQGMMLNVRRESLDHLKAS